MAASPGFERPPLALPNRERDDSRNSTSPVAGQPRPLPSRIFQRLTLAGSPGSVQPKADFYPGLDLLRGFAAISVVVYHAIDHFKWTSFPRDNVVCLWFRLGWMGVDLFFVISGFVIALSALKLIDRNPADYARLYCARRLARIVPLHYLTCLLWIVFIMPAVMFDSRFGWHALSHLTFTHNWWHLTIGSLNGPNWSLGVEMQFYVLILLLAPWLRRAKPWAALLGCVAVSWTWRGAACAWLHGLTRDGVDLLWAGIMQVPGMLDLFGFGIALAIVAHRDNTGRLARRIHAVRWLLPLVTALAATATMRFYWIYGTNWATWPMIVFWRTALGGTCLLAVLSACALDDRWFLTLTAPLRYLGTISYGIYLWHMLMIFTLKTFFLDDPAHGCLWALGLTLLFASLSWHFFEKPLMERFGRGVPRGGGVREAAGSARAVLIPSTTCEMTRNADRLIPGAWVLPVWAKPLFGWGAPLLFVFIAFWPAWRRIARPTLLGDDITRLVHLIRLSFVDHLFQPFSDHITPLCQLVSWLTWQIIGHDVRWAPLGFCTASILPWVLVLILLAYWLARETGSRTASLAAVAVVAQSPLVLESVYWYSASSFLWAIVFVLVAVIGASTIARRSQWSLVLIGIGSMFGPAATTLGILAAPLAILRAVFEPRTSRRAKLLAILAGVAGVWACVQFSSLGNVGPLRSADWWNKPRIELLAGLGYALTVPGRVLWPSIVGAPASWTSSPLPAGVCWAAGALALGAFAIFLLWPRPPWDRRLVLAGGAMIYLGYALVYPARVCAVRMGYWTEAQLLYHFAGRYHVLPLLGAAAMIAALLAAWPLIRRCDKRRGLPALIGTLVGLASLAIERDEAAGWEWMLHQPDQKATLKALHRVGWLAREEGIPRSQLVRIFDPCFRSWNGSVLHDHPDTFHLMELAAVAPNSVEHPLPDPVARRKILAHLTRYERTVLGAGACVSFNPPRLSGVEETVAVARRVEMRYVDPIDRGRYHGENGDSYIEFEFEAAPQARFLYLPGLQADQDILVLPCDEKGRWRSGLHVRWLQSPGCDAAAAIDIERPIHWPLTPISRIRMQFTRPGEIALSEPPRLVR
ncbi:MAG: acyltransferase family protein [Isosphaeraceae bacterium]